MSKRKTFAKLFDCTEEKWHALQENREPEQFEACVAEIHTHGETESKIILTEVFEVPNVKVETKATRKSFEMDQLYSFYAVPCSKGFMSDGFEKPKHEYYSHSNNKANPNIPFHFFGYVPE